jgi:hypothetical protein
LQRTGLIMKLTDKTAIVLTQLGEFVRVPREVNMEVGMEVPISTVSVSHRTCRSPRWQRFGAAAAAACLVVAAGVWFGVGQMGDDTAFAYVSMDINPSVAFTIDKAERVIDVVGLNPDGKALVAELHVDRTPLKDAIQDAIDDAVSQQMLPNADPVLVTAAPATTDTNISKVSSSLKADVQSALQHNTKAESLHPTVYTLQVSNTVWEAALKANISPGKFASYVIARQEGHTFALDDLEGENLGTVLSSSKSATNVISALKSGDDNKLRSIIQTLTAPTSTKPVTSNIVGNAPSGHHTLPSGNKTGTVSTSGGSGESGKGLTNPSNQGSGNTENTIQSPPQSPLPLHKQTGITVTLAGKQFQIEVGKASKTSSPTNAVNIQSVQNHVATQDQSPTNGTKMPGSGDDSTNNSTINGIVSSLLG